MWSVLDYNTVCREPEGFWDSGTRPASPTSYDPSSAEFDEMHPDEFGNLFPVFSIPALNGSSPPDGAINDNTLMLSNQSDMAFAEPRHSNTTF